MCIFCLIIAEAEELKFQDGKIFDLHITTNSHYYFYFLMTFQVLKLCICMFIFVAVCSCECRLQNRLSDDLGWSYRWF